MIYAPNDPTLLKFFKGESRTRLALRIAYIKFVLPLKGRVSTGLYNHRHMNKTYEVQVILDKIRQYLFTHEVSYGIIQTALHKWGLAPKTQATEQSSLVVV